MVTDVSTFIAYSLGGGLLGLLVAGLAAAALGRAPAASRGAAYGGALGAALLLAGAAIATLLDGPTTYWLLWHPVAADAFELRFELRLDPLAAFFLLVIAVGSLAVSVYAPRYTAHYAHYRPAVLGPAYTSFLLSMVLVVLAANAFTFLIAWELMALVSYLLVVTDHHDPEVQGAGFIYLVMTHTGTAFLIVAFLLLYAQTGSLDFAVWTSGPHLGGWVRDVAFLCALVGFGTKAGMIPLHIWLPRAHPVAPSHVSALMSGVMLKTAIYGLVRLIFEVLGGAPWPSWWGGLLLALGVVSAVLGVLYALMESDLKRLLAYSSVENIGIILIGLGAALLLGSGGHPELAAVGLLAALYHTLNHALFKGLLFLGAGAVHYATGTQQIEALGGLVRRLPWTAALFLVGALAISGLPPFNGFVSEWLTFQSLLAAGANLAPLPALAALVAAGGLALTAALAAACFVKAFGITFLALPRSLAVSQAREVPQSMRAGMGLLALACLGLGLLPGLVPDLLQPVLRQVGLRPALAADAQGASAGVSLAAGLGQIVPGVLLAIGLVLVPLPWLLARVGGRSRPRVVPTWACGGKLQSINEYTGPGFVKPFRIIFRALLQPQREVETEYGATPYFPIRMYYHGSVPPLIEQRLYRPIVRVVLAVTRRIRLLQSGSVQHYLAYIFITLLVLLLLTR